MEKRDERLAADQHINNQWERMISIQAGLQSSMATIENFQKGMQQQMHLLNEQMQQQIRGKSILGKGPSAPVERGSNSSQNRNNTHSTSETHVSNYTPFPKIEFPHFDGENPRSWILRSNRYFQVINTISEEQKVTLASVYLEGKAELWFQGYMEGKELPSWQQFTIAILERFDESDLDLIVGNFNKLHQTCSVADYLERFEEMKSHILIFNKDLPEEFFSASFLSGLNEESRGAVMALKPNDFHQAVSLAKRQESTVDAIIKRANMSSRNFSQTKPNFRTTPNNHQNSRNPQLNPKPPYPSHTENPPPHRKLLTTSKMRARREKNLCYNCDETFIPGHRCKQRQIYMMMSEEEELLHESLNEMETNNEIEEEIIDEDITVSLNALSGTTNMNTLRIKGVVKGQDVHILIDSGSTHCFLDESTAHKLGCKLDYTTPMIVSVADGSKMKIGSVAYKLLLPVNIQIHPVFHVCLLKKKIGHCHSTTIQLPAIDNEGQIQVYPLAVLSRRIIPRNGTVATQVLVHWVDSSPEQASLEDLTSLRSRFPSFDPWGQGSIEEGGNVRPTVSCAQLEGRTLIARLIGAKDIHRRIFQSKHNRQMKVNSSQPRLISNNSVPLMRCHHQRQPCRLPSASAGTAQITSFRRKSNGSCSAIQLNMRQRIHHRIEETYHIDFINSVAKNLSC
ncbi:hypothetical protein BUALT_Bualt09G0041000 [Buddleja alternifolia]|uniref:Retrotransposon gag domain-containing protein n=1 Tax=Buddleja alternifolia TaxID=168488 RepID=A0AAV6WZ61_9LAMI|nr:hypothetical protein BUALT_Bualt09G0041000 [Buddleja alternifolia]